MNQIEFDFMKGMVSILNEAAEAYYKGEPIITNEQYDVRIEDLKQLEKETAIMFVNSPTIKEDNTINDEISYLVCPQDFDMFESKKVKELGINIVSEEELIKMLN